MIAVSAVLAAYESITRLIDPQPMTNIPIVIAAGFIGFAGNEAVALYRIRVGRYDRLGGARRRRLPRPDRRAHVARGRRRRARRRGRLPARRPARRAAHHRGHPRRPQAGDRPDARAADGRGRARARRAGRDRSPRRCPRSSRSTGCACAGSGHALEASLAITVDCDMTVAAGPPRLRGGPPPPPARHPAARHRGHPRQPVRPRRRGPARAHPSTTIRALLGRFGPVAAAKERPARSKWVTREHPHTDRIACPG